MVHPRHVPSVQLNGPALRCIRERSGISCSALARAVGTDVSFLARVERGEKRGIGRETFERICFELEIHDPRAILVHPFGPSTPDRPHRGASVVDCGGTTSTAA